ncbi:MAG: glutamate formimidoyltransferase [Anaerolineae bacterium]|nr:glutamate formimidoyltransferase [Anaerolineae bacterium]
MQPLVECVPNFSEGRRPEIVEAILDAIRQAAPVHILDSSSDADHNRSVVTFVGAPEAVEQAAFAAIQKAAGLIDLNRHEGEHPRIGATDVVPFVPLRGVTMADCIAIAQRVGARVGETLNIPVYLYEAAATRPDRENLETIRKGSYEGLREAIQTDPDRAPDFGPAMLGPAGATVIGARPFLIAYNVYLNTGDVEIAKKIAREVRHSGGGMRYLKALGLLVDGRAQVSMNFTNFEKTPLHRVVELIRREAARYGVLVTDSELIGLIPQKALVESAQWYLQLDDLAPEQIIENRLDQLQAAELDTTDALRPEAFLNAVAGGEPTPGGGAVAALAGALSAALAAMVARTTVGKPRYAGVEAQMQDIIGAADRVRGALADAIAEDVAAFDAVMDAYKLKKDDPQRGARIQAALIGAVDVPLRVARLARESLSFAHVVAAQGNKNAATDAAVAAHMGLAAVEGAALNVLVNLQGMIDAARAGQVRQEILEIQTEARDLHRQIVAVAEARAGLG